ncbi:APTX (predicted) [Pycnogonum litorale]
MALKRKCEQSDSSSSVKKGHWSQGLKVSMNDPKLKVEEDDKIIVIKDMYPKAKHHFLVLPKLDIPNLKSLSSIHIPLLKHMEAKGKCVAERTDPHSHFKYGYHAVPSMGHIHLHVISQDFDSSCLKTKKHWNSFNTPYFVNSKDLLKQLEESGVVTLISPSRSKQLLDTPLKCHKCNQLQKNMPKLKDHINKCEMKFTLYVVD